MPPVRASQEVPRVSPLDVTLMIRIFENSAQPIDIECRRPGCALPVSSSPARFTNRQPPACLPKPRRSRVTLSVNPLIRIHTQFSSVSPVDCILTNPRLSISFKSHTCAHWGVGGARWHGHSCLPRRRKGTCALPIWEPGRLCVPLRTRLTGPPFLLSPVTSRQSPVPALEVSHAIFRR